jgi:hypothetical protein
VDVAYIEEKADKLCAQVPKVIKQHQSPQIIRHSQKIAKQEQIKIWQRDVQTATRSMNNTQSKQKKSKIINAVTASLCVHAAPLYT